MLQVVRDVRHRHYLALTVDEAQIVIRNPDGQIATGLRQLISWIETHHPARDNQTIAKIPNAERNCQVVGHDPRTRTYDGIEERTIKRVEPGIPIPTYEQDTHDELVKFFRSPKGYLHFGQNGDDMNKSPATCAIDAMEGLIRLREGKEESGLPKSNWQPARQKLGTSYSAQLKSGAQWARERGTIIMDPDGWRMQDGIDLDTPITFDDYFNRLCASTIQINIDNADHQEMQRRREMLGR